MFDSGKPFQPIVLNHSCLMGPFVSNEQNEMLWIWHLVLYSQHFIFFVLMNWTNKLDCLSMERLSGPMQCNTRAFGPIHKLQRKWSVVNKVPGVVFTTLHFLCGIWMDPIQFQSSIRDDISTNAQTLKHNINNVCNLIKLKQAI